MPREVAVLTAVAFAVMVGFGIVFPVIPLFADSFGVSTLAASAVISIFALTRFASSPPAGWLVDKVGERLILGTGIFIVALSSAMAGLAQNYWQFLVLRGIGGVGSAMFTVAAYALLLRVVLPDQRGRAALAFQGGFLIGGIAGPLFGAPLVAISIRLPFFLYAGTLLVAGSIGLVFLAHSRLQEREEKVGTDAPPTPLSVAVHHPTYWAAVSNNLATGWALFGVRGSVLPLFVTEALLLSESWVALGIFISAVAQGLVLIPAGRASDMRGRRPSMIVGSLVMGGAFVLIAGIESLPAYVVAMVLFGVGSALLGTSSNAAVGDVVHGRGGTAIGVYQMASDLGAFAGPLIAGLLVDALNFSWAFAVTAVVCIFGTVMAVRSPETLQRTSTAS
ncbi:MAG TPA: MFS transporter [Actinomycetes bacterium]|nr:MFS transporter [Actinomycetes bacterium]